VYLLDSFEVVVLNMQFHEESVNDIHINLQSTELRRQVRLANNSVQQKL